MSNAHLLHEAYARYSRGDYGIVDDLFAESIEWKIPGLVEVEGRAAVRGFFESLGEQFASHAIAMTDHVDAGDRFVAFVTHTFTRHDGEAADMLAVHSWRVAGGMLTALYEITDSATFAVFTGQLAPVAQTV